MLKTPKKKKTKEEITNEFLNIKKKGYAQTSTYLRGNARNLPMKVKRKTKSTIFTTTLHCVGATR